MYKRQNLGQQAAHRAAHQLGDVLMYGGDRDGRYAGKNTVIEPGDGSALRDGNSVGGQRVDDAERHEIVGADKAVRQVAEPRRDGRAGAVVIDGGQVLHRDAAAGKPGIGGSLNQRVGADVQRIDPGGAGQAVQGAVPGGGQVRDQCAHPGG